MMVTATSLEMNSLEFKLLRGIFEKQHMKTAMILTNRMIERDRNQSLTVNPAENPKASWMKNQIISKKVILSKYTRMFRRIN